MDRSGHRRAACGSDRPAASAVRGRRWLKRFAGGKQVRPMLSGCRGKPSTRHDVRRERDLAHPVIVTTRAILGVPSLPVASLDAHPAESPSAVPPYESSKNGVGDKTAVLEPRESAGPRACALTPPEIGSASCRARGGPKG